MKLSSVIISLFIVAVLAGGIYLATVFAQKRFQIQEEETVAAQEVPVTGVAVQLGKISDVIELTGYIEPEDQVSVIAKLSMPGKLTRNLVDEGEQVKKNQVIAYVDRDEVGAKYAPYPVKAPLSGTVATIMSDKGAVVTAQVPVAVIINIDNVKVKSSVIEKDYPKVKYGLPAQVTTDAFPGRVFQGKVTKIAPTLDQLSHTATIEITIPNPDRELRPGMFVETKVIVDTKENVPVLPKRAVVKRQGRSVVYKVENGVVNIVPVTLGYYDLNAYEIKEGLKPDDIVVLEEQAILQDGINVTVANRLQARGSSRDEPPLPTSPAKLTHSDQKQAHVQTSHD